MISTSKLSNFQIPGRPLKQLLGKPRSSLSQVPQYRKINRANPNVDPSRFQDYMLFQSALLTYRLSLQRMLVSYPFIQTVSNVCRDWSFAGTQTQLSSYFDYLSKSSIFQKYMLTVLKTSTMCLTSVQDDVIPVPFFDLVNQRTLFQNNVNDLQRQVNRFDNNIITKKFYGISSTSQNQIVNKLQPFQFIARDKTYKNTVPRQYTQTMNRRGQIFNLLPSVYYSKDFQFQSLLNIFRQNYDKVWLKSKAIKNANKISYDKHQKQYLGDFIKQRLHNNGIQYYDINPKSITNSILYNYVPKNINPSNTRYIPLGFSYGYLSDQFLYRMSTQRMLLLNSKGTRQPLQRLVNMYGLRNRSTGDFSGSAWVNIVDFQRYYGIQTLFDRKIGRKTFTDLQSTIDDQIFILRSNAASAVNDTTFNDFGRPYGFGLVIDLVEDANDSIRSIGLLDHGLTTIDFRDSLSSYVLGSSVLTGNRIDTWPLYGPTASTSGFSFTRRFKQIGDVDYILNPFFNVRQQFYPSKNNHIDGVLIKPCIHDLDTVSDKRVSPIAGGLKTNDDKMSITASMGECDLISHVAKYTDLDIFKKYIQSQIKIVPKRKTQIDISNITQLQNQFGAQSTRTTGAKTFSMSLSGFDTGSSTFRFKRRFDDTVGNDSTSKILNMRVLLKQADSRKIVQSTQNIIKLSFNAVQDLYSNSVSQDNVRQYNNIKKQFNFVDFFIYPNPQDKTTYITKRDLLQKQFLLPITSDGLLCSIYGWSGFDMQKQQVFEWTLGIQDLSSGDKLSFQFKFNRQL